MPYNATTPPVTAALSKIGERTADMTQGSEGPGQAAPATLPGLRRLTLGWTGPERLEVFSALPPETQRECWEALREGLRLEREIEGWIA